MQNDIEATPSLSLTEQGRAGLDQTKKIEGPDHQPTGVNKSDIEHAPVEDDPRKWSATRKWTVLIIVSFASMIAGLSANIYNPAIGQIERQLHATSGEISLSLSLFILIQGATPLIWTAVSEIKGRKLVYIVSISLNVIGTICAATANSIGVLIGMRCLQAIGGSAVMSIGAATLADIYDPAERGTMMGIYYIAPLFGPSLGPIIGGVLTQLFDWRATFWFLTIFGALNVLSFIFGLKDTFRRERSITYQVALSKRMAEAREKAARSSTRTSEETAAGFAVDKEKNAIEGTTPEPIVPVAPEEMEEIKLSFKDINPFPQIWIVIRRKHNLAMLLASGLLFAFAYCISYTCSRTLANAYHYDALKIGLVLLAYGVGSICGSILGGRYSDRMLARLKAANGGKSYPEMRLASTKIGLIGLPPSVIAYAWLAQKHVHIAAICVALFVCGFFSIWAYASTLAYIVDSNVGRSSTAVALNSCYRGLFAFIFTEVAVPLQDSIGDGGLYSIWTGLAVLIALCILLVFLRGGRWREKAEEQEAARAAR